MVRAADGPLDVVNEIVSAYAKDPSSVVPELLIQSYDARAERGASRVFAQIKDHAHPELLLRLMNTSLTEKVRAQGFNLICDWYSERGSTEPGVIRALVDLHQDPREQFIKDYLSIDATGVQKCFLASWAAYILRGNYVRRLTSWQDQFRSLAVKLTQQGIHADSTVLSNWAILTATPRRPDHALA
jgi:hypothetical protein